MSKTIDENANNQKNRAEERLRLELRKGKDKKIAIAITLMVLILSALFLIVNAFFVVPNRKYNDAIQLEEDGRYQEAINAFDALNGYKDSHEHIEICYQSILGEERYEYLSSLKIGDTLFMGRYEQNDIRPDGVEPVEWRVLDKDGMKMLLISSKCIEMGNFDDMEQTSRWKESQLRLDLNSTILDSIFSKEEQEFIIETNTGDENNEIKDQLFILNNEEAEKYFNSDVDRICEVTDYVFNNRYHGFGAVDDSKKCDWWLRDIGAHLDHVMTVLQSGKIYEYGDPIERRYSNGVRPAFWYDPAYDAGGLKQVDYDEINKSKDNLRPYLEILGQTAKNDTIDVSQEFVDNSLCVEIDGIVGTVTYGINGSADRVNVMTWLSNKLYTADEYEAYIGKLRRLWGKDSEKINYDKIKVGYYYMWEDNIGEFYDSYTTSMFYLDSGNICIRWNLKDPETVYEPPKSDTSENKTEIHKCIECGKRATHWIESPFSGQIEWYCDDCFKELNDLIDGMINSSK